ncbi:hypothetical protein ACTRW9_12555 [Nitrospina sp. 32_T5]|uniref:hypothetical protein n=1 Tax=unclassified Nitrospina TaxID=2638683 RepID=UPI003F9E06C0
MVCVKNTFGADPQNEPLIGLCRHDDIQRKTPLGYLVGLVGAAFNQNGGLMGIVYKLEIGGLLRPFIIPVHPAKEMADGFFPVIPDFEEDEIPGLIQFVIPVV